MGPLVAFIPFLGAKVVPMTSRAGLALFLSLLFMPTSIFSSMQVADYNELFPLLAIKEILIGFCLSMIASLPFWAAESSGIIIDFSRGSSSMMGQNVLTQNQASPMGVFYNYLLIYFFYLLGGAELFYDAVVTSYDFIPTSELVPLGFFNLKNEFWKISTQFMQQLFSLSIRFSAPVLLAILMTDLFLGIANRLAPQVQISFLGQALKSLMALFLLWAGWAFMLKNMNNETISLTKGINFLLQKMQLEYHPENLPKR
jgi:type III secretory pathway component EscT